jgi:hypothetical protein
VELQKLRKPVQEEEVRAAPLVKSAAASRPQIQEWQMELSKLQGEHDKKFTEFERKKSLMNDEAFAAAAGELNELQQRIADLRERIEQEQRKPGKEAEVPPSTRNVELSGTWAGSGTDNTGPGNLTFSLNQYGEDLTGASTAADSASGKTISGQVTGTKSGSTVFGTITEKYENCAIKIEFVAQVSGNLMKGTYSGTNSCGQPITDGRFTLTKQ